MNEELTKEQKLFFIEQETQIHNNNVYVLNIRYRVNKKLGNVDACKECEKEIVKEEMAISELKQIKEELG